ncbi:LacI family DNA-binding transcriptional regulator [Chitinophaga lutea]
MPPKQVNIRALARELNLSVSTISKALRDSYEISPATKARVLALAASLQYQPNPYASSLRGKKSRTVGVVVPEVADSFFSLAINGIESVLKAAGYHVLICLTHEQLDNEKGILQEFRNGRVDGVLLSISRETADAGHIRALAEQEVPLVFFDRVLDEVAAAKVVTNDYESGYAATRHLAERGCRDIGFLGISNSLSISNKRMEGYLQALQDLGLPFRESNIVACSNDLLSNYRTITKLLQRRHRPDGLVASVEKLTASTYQACRDLNLRIPDDVKVICFSNLEIAAMLQPSLTTITQPAFEMGKAAAQLLLKAMKGKDVRGGDVVIPSVLEERGSTGALH